MKINLGSGTKRYPEYINIDSDIGSNPDYVVDIEKEKLFDEKNEEVKLAKKEILLFNLFAKNLEKVISFEQIEQYVWEGDLTTNENIRALVKRLRKKLPIDTIISQGGMGYILSVNKSKS